jgi:hypothetical protein
MKKVLFVMVLVMAAMVVNAQTTRTAVKVVDLQKAITDNVAKDYVGFTIKNAVKVTTNNVVTYDVVVSKGTTTETLVYDKDGKFVKKATQKAGTTEKKVTPKPAAGTAAAPAKKN